MKTRQAYHAAANVAAGKCRNCGRPRGPGHERCETCNKKRRATQRDAARAHRARCQAEGKCIDCGCKKTAEGLRCTGCKQKNAASIKRSREKAKSA